MNLRFNTSLAEGYKSASQIARVLTDDWLAHNMYCPICCEETIRHAEPNLPVKDYVVICSKFTTFVVESTTIVLGNTIKVVKS